MRPIYTAQSDLETGLWQILSRSGHVVYESADADYVRAVCRELCNLATRRQPVGVAVGVVQHNNTCYA